MIYDIDQIKNHDLLAGAPIREPAPRVPEEGIHTLREFILPPRADRTARLGFRVHRPARPNRLGRPTVRTALLGFREGSQDMNSNNV